MKRRRLYIILTLAIVAMLFGVATFFRVRYLTLMCNVSYAEAERVATYATLCTVVDFMFGTAMAWLSYYFDFFQDNRRLTIGALFVTNALMGMETFFIVKSKIHDCTREYVDVAKFPDVIYVASVFATAAFALGAISILLGHFYGIFKKD